MDEKIQQLIKSLQEKATYRVELMKEDKEFGNDIAFRIRSGEHSGLLIALSEIDKIFGTNARDFEREMVKNLPPIGRKV